MFVLQFYQHYIYIAEICWDASCDPLALLLTFQRFLVRAAAGEVRIHHPRVWPLVQLPSGCHLVSCRWQRSIVVTLFPNNRMLQNPMVGFYHYFPITYHYCWKHNAISVTYLVMVFTDEKSWWLGGCHLWPARVCHIRSDACTEGMISDCHGWYQIWKDIWFPIGAIAYYWFLVTLVLGYWHGSLMFSKFDELCEKSVQFVVFDQVTWDEDIMKMKIMMMRMMMMTAASLAKEYLAQHGLRKFFQWYDYMSWYPIGRPIGRDVPSHG